MTAVRYYRNHREAPRVPIDNSPTEREFQNVAKLRRNVTDRRRRGDAQFGAWHDVSAVV
jgi:hypothetical protein